MCYNGWRYIVGVIFIFIYEKNMRYGGSAINVPVMNSDRYIIYH